MKNIPHKKTKKLIIHSSNPWRMKRPKWKILNFVYENLHNHVWKFSKQKDLYGKLSYISMQVLFCLNKTNFQWLSKPNFTISLSVLSVYINMVKSWTDEKFSCHQNKFIFGKSMDAIDKIVCGFVCCYTQESWVLIYN